MPHPVALSRSDLPRFHQIAPTGVVLLAGLALSGWALSLDWLRAIVPVAVAMNPATAVTFLLAGTALWLVSNGPTVRSRTIARILAGLVLSAGLVVLAGYAAGRDPLIDRLLFADDLQGNRMAPNTAAHFLLVGLSLLLLDKSTRSGFWLGQVPAFAAALGALFALVGYGLHATNFYGLPSHIPMALNTAIGFEILALGLLCARPDRGLVAFVTGRGAGGFVARRLLPIAIVAPILLGWLRLHGERIGLYETEFGVALMVVTTILLFLAAIWWTARALDQSDAHRREAEQRLQMLHSELEQRVRERTQELADANAALTAEMAERARAVAAEQESQQYFRMLVDGVKDYAILMLDPDGCVASWNAGAERIKGYTAGEIIGEHFSRFYPEPDRHSGRPERELQIALTEGRYEEEGWRVRKNGSQFWANVVVTPVRDEQGRLRGFSKVTRDVTERKQAEERVQRLNNDLEQQLSKLAQANRELAQKTDENETFVYSVSHDLRSPLVNLQGFSKELSAVSADLREILAENELPPAVRERALGLVDDEMGESIRFIQTAVMRLSSIIDALLRLSRAGRLEYRSQPVDLNATVRRIVDALSSTIAERGVTVTVKELPPVWGDPTALEQVFANLIGNAINYLDPQRPGRIEVGCSDEVLADDPGHVPLHACYVQDNGLGIPESARSKVFQAFQRLHPDRAKGEGMGLPMVRRIVERHGGRIWIESEVNVGSTFYVSLPSVPAQAGAVRQSGTVEERSTVHVG